MARPLAAWRGKLLLTQRLTVKSTGIEKCAVPSCPGADSNRYAFRHHPLKMACLPISPPGQNYSWLLPACCSQQADGSKPPSYGADGARTRDLSSDSRVL